jgi:hypothetical protein
MTDKKCAPNAHDYVEFSRGGYYKLSGKTNEWGMTTYDQSISYQKLYCRCCGNTIEVIARNHRQGSA